MKMTESSQHELARRLLITWETKDSPFLMLVGGCSSFSAAGSEKPKAGSMKVTGGSLQAAGFGGANSSVGSALIGASCEKSKPRKIPVEGRSETKFTHGQP